MLFVRFVRFIRQSLSRRRAEEEALGPRAIPARQAPAEAAGAASAESETQKSRVRLVAVSLGAAEGRKYNNVTVNRSRQ
jgi:hypothetical protein